VMLIFLVQGVVIGTVGTIVGAAVGATVAHLLDTYRVISIPGDVYQVTYLPFRVLPRDLIAIVIGGFVICFFATLYPSRQAARLDPAQALRYE
jgi:lipoprotein-releasing system permease protein